MVHGGGTRSASSRHSGRSRNSSMPSNSRSRQYQRRQQRPSRLFNGGLFTPRMSNTNHYHLHTSPAYVPVATRSPGIDRGDDDDCCCCCRPLCWFCATPRHDLESTPDSPVVNFCWQKLPGIFVLSLVVFGILVAISSQDSRWILNAGESRRIEPAFLTSTINLQVEWDSHQGGVNVSVYALKKCPPLTGLPVSVSDKKFMTLGRGDYQYDYFYLNAGSKISASFSQSQGSSKIILLRGSNILSRLEGQTGDIDWDDIDRSAISKWYINSGSSTKTINYRAGRTDVYTLLYDNTANSIGMLSMEYSMKLTTYKLEGHDFVCSDAATNICPPIKTKGAGCIIVDTSSGSPDEKGNEVSLKIHGNRSWLSIFLLSILPGTLIIAWHIYDEAKMRQVWQPVSSSDDADDEVAHAVPPPATAPGHEAASSEVMLDPSASAGPLPPSAPAAELDTDDSTIPIARAEVISENVSESTSLPVVDVPIDQVDPMPVLQK